MFQNYQIYLSAILLYLGNALKELPLTIFRYLKNIMSIEITTESRNREIYDRFSNYLLSLNINSINNHNRIYSKWDGEKYLTSRSISEGNYIFFINKALCVLTCSLIANKDDIYYNLQLSVYGFNKKKVKEAIMDKIKTDPIEERNYICVVDHSKYEHMKIRKRSIDTVVLENKDVLFKGIDFWKNNKEYYISHGMPYKYCILLVGPPGTGKSSLCKVIASYLNYDIESFSLVEDNKDLENKLAINTARHHELLLFEDADCTIDVKRNLESDKKSDSEKESEKKAKLQLVLNFIDGINSPEDCVFVVTTNNENVFDEAFLRRFDLRLNVDLFDKKLTEEMCHRFDDRLKGDRSFLKEDEYPYKPSKLQTKILNYIQNM